MIGNTKSNRKVFFSYSWKDMKIAMRLYDDLTRSHIDVWRDQIDGDPTADFLEEFLTKIDECDDFIILDSKNYRTKSNWCLTEIERCFENRAKRNAPRIIVCLLDKNGEWRNEYKNEKQEKYFSQINLYKFHELYYDGIYDNENIYQHSVSNICTLFDEKFTPWNCMPLTKDLLEELSVHNGCITDEDRTIILNGYNYIHRLITLQRDVKKHFELWISDCNFYKLNLFFPRWTYCVWLGHNMHKGLYNETCYKEFEILAKDFPNDPRCYRGLGGIAARLGYNQIAISSYLEAEKLMNIENNLWHKKHSLLEVLTNISQVLINIGNTNHAIDYLYKALDIMNSNCSYNKNLVLNISYCLLNTNRVAECKELLLELLRIHKLESELYVELGYIYSIEDNNSKAIEYFTKAYSLEPSIKNAFSLLCRQSIIKDICIEAKLILLRDENDFEDYYYKGAICYYLLNDIRKAKSYYNKCNNLFNWYQ